MTLMDLPVIQADGNPSSTVAVDETVFGVPFKEPLVHQVVTAYLAGGSTGTNSQKNQARVPVPYTHLTLPTIFSV